MVKNGDMRFLLLELKLADQLANLPPSQYRHLVVKNGNFTFLLIELILANQLADLLSPHLLNQCIMGKSFLPHTHNLIMGCIWQPFWILTIWILYGN